MSNRHPNIVCILADDLGYGDVSCLNPESKIRTPFMDRFASEGMTFTDGHSNSAVCTPTRYGILTGRYCWRSRLKSGVLFGYNRTLIEPGRLTVASMLKNAGYDTACIGKWHLGLDWVGADGTTLPDGCSPEDIDWSQPLAGGAHTAGFDYSCIIPASLDMAPYCYVEDGRVVEPATATCDESPWPAFWRGGACAPGFQHETCLLELTMKAESYIHERAKNDTPFFLYFPTPSPHTPHTPRPPFQGASDCGTYGDYVTEHDWSVGRVLAALERNGLAENTLVLITSDNGAHCATGSTGMEGFHFERQYGHRSSYIYRGMKSDAWDGGHRIPCLVRWPGVVAPGSTCDKTICLTDLMATAASITGQTLPEDAGEDSFDLTPYLRGETERAIRPSTIHHSISGKFAIRKGKWKLLDCPGSGGWSLPDDSVPESEPRMQLYDMAAEPEERTNRFEQESAVAEELLADLEQARAADRTAPA